MGVSRATGSRTARATPSTCKQCTRLPRPSATRWRPASRTSSARALAFALWAQNQVGGSRPRPGTARGRRAPVSPGRCPVSSRDRRRCCRRGAVALTAWRHGLAGRARRRRRRAAPRRRSVPHPRPRGGRGASSGEGPTWASKDSHGAWAPVRPCQHSIHWSAAPAWARRGRGAWASPTTWLSGAGAQTRRTLGPAGPRLGREGWASPGASPRHGSGGQAREQAWA
jgi:hypothetical protein